MLPPKPEKIRPQPPNRIEPFGRPGRLIVNQADKGQELQPRSALTPPRSPAPIKATRPDFPVWAGHFFAGRVSSDAAAALRQLLSLCDAVAPSPRESEKIEGANQCVFRVQPDPVISSTLSVRVVDATIPASQFVS
jgi:hypothetical protein